MGSINKQISRYDFTAVYTHPDAKVDVVLIHGLNGDPQRSWTAAKNGVFWPTDLLPASLKTAHANVLVYGYNADVYSSRHDRSASDNFIHHHAQTLVTSLTHYRKSEDSMQHPIIWVAHSFGGILTKSALLYSNDVRNDHHRDYRSIFVSTYAIIFLGTPHSGSDIATWGHMLQSMSDAVIPKRFFESEPVLLKTLKKDNETLQNINSHFLDVYQRFIIHMAHENHKTDIKGAKIVVVDSSSASPQLPGVTYYGIEATHSRMCKYESANAPGYRIVATAIRDWVLEAPPVIQVRWRVELDDRDARARLEFSEQRIRHLGTPNTSQTQAIVQPNNETTLPAQKVPEPSAPAPAPEHLPLLSEASQPGEFEANRKNEPLFIHPEPFRPNSFFVGRAQELKYLHKMLMDRKRRSEGTSAVLIQCLPGGGKTHLARQYVFQYRDHYPGGIYWVRAKSRQEMEYWYWRIAKNEALKGTIAQEDAQELRNPKKIVTIVRKWLNSLGNWLLVLDGIHFDTPGLHEFIPDARDTSLIFTSTQRAVTGDYQFDNPQVMELGLLAAQEAQELLLLEMDKRKPWTHDDRARALELVQLMGRLPLMIHVVAQQLKATREPLSKYLRSYRNRPNAGSLTAYRAVRDQLQHRGATEALNLMSVLVFFDQHVPVEMLTLGLSALDNRTPVRTCDASHRKANLNNTLAVLIAFALLERSESDDMSPNSSRSSRKSFDKNADYFDLLRVHSVVQAFFIDTLAEDKEVQFWLERAVAVWCHSFDRADQRIKGDSKVGLPDDYRRYAIHGRRLVQHLDRFERKSPELLGRTRDQIEWRLKRIDQEVDQLSHTIQAHIVEGSGEVPPASVFERTSSSSETDSTTPPSHSSMDELGPIRGNEQRFQPPLPCDTDCGHNPYHWHVPYPHRPTMPPTPEPDDDDDVRTVVGASSINDGVATPTSWLSFGPSGLSTGLLQPPQAYSDWELAVPHHRAVRKVEDRRYHDRAGSWRDSTVSDPRVSISREIAKGSISSIGDRSKSPSRSRVTAESEAELQLYKIRTACPPSPHVGSYFDVAVSLGTGTRARPRLIMGTNAYADPSATKTPENDYSISPAEFSTSLARIASSPSSWTAATMKRLKENLKPPQSLSADRVSVAEPTDNAHEVGDPRHDDKLQVSPGPLFRGSRSENSSSGSRSPPLPRPVPIEISAAGAPQHHFPATVRHWETHAYHPSLERLASSSLSYPQDPMSLSYPFPQRDPYTTTFHLPGQPWVHSPGGYTSQPMTRDPSHQSTSPSNPHPPVPHHHQTHLAMPPSTPTRTPSPLADNSPPSRPGSSGDRASRLFPFRRGRRRRRPSHTETEPSPRLEAVYPDVRTSYQSWEDRQHVTAQPGDEPPWSSSPDAGWRFARAGRGRQRTAAAAAAAGRRAQSQSPTTTPATMTTTTTRGRGIGRLGFTPRRRGTREGGDESSGFDVLPVSAAGADMLARSEPGPGSGSRSGGFMLPDGRVVGFGDIVAVDAPAGPVGGRRRLARRRRGGWDDAENEEVDEGLGLGLGIQ